MVGRGRRENDGSVEGTLLSSPARWGLGGLGALVVAALAGMLLLRPGVEQFEAGSPEAAVQGYLEAVLDGDHRAALEYLTPELRDACRSEVRHAWVPDSARVTLAGTHVEGGRAEVDVVVTELRPPGPFGPESHSVDVTLFLERADERWAISAAPWPVWTCGELP